MAKQSTADLYWVVLSTRVSLKDVVSVESAGLERLRKAQKALI